MKGSENSRVRTESSKVRIGEKSKVRRGEKSKVMKWRRASMEGENGK